MAAVPRSDYNTLVTQVTKNISDIATANSNISSVSSKVSNLESDTGNTTIVRDIADARAKAAPDTSLLALKTDLNSYIKTSDLAQWLKDNGYVKGGTTTTTPGGTITTGEGYAITLDHNQIISMSSETGNKDVTVTVVNNNATAGTPSLLITLTPLSPSTFETVNLTSANVTSYLSGWTGTFPGTVQPNPDATSLIRKVQWFTSEIPLSGSGGSKILYLGFAVRTTNVVTWTLEIKAL
jgi:hypothetical protein